LAGNEPKWLQADPQVPEFVWIVANIVCDKIQEYDAIIMIRGPRGSGKSTLSINIAISLAYTLSKILNKPMSSFFNFWDNIKSVDKDGTFEMFSGDIIRKGHQVLIADDFGIAADSRDFMTDFNKKLVKIFTACRPYRAVIILNAPESEDIDKKIRRYATIQIEINGVYRPTKKTVCRVTIPYKKKGKSEMGGKYFRCHGKRVTTWVADKPPEWAMKYYRAIRMKNTNELLDEVNRPKEEKERGGNNNGGARQTRYVQNIKTQYGDEVIRLHSEGMKMKAIARKIGHGMTDYLVGKCLEGIT
jgi:hypothetical protein